MPNLQTHHKTKIVGIDAIVVGIECQNCDDPCQFSMKTLHQYYYYNKVLPIGTSINVEVEVEKVFSTPLRSSLAKGGLSVAFAGLLPLYYQYHFFSYLLHPNLTHKER